MKYWLVPVAAALMALWSMPAMAFLAGEGFDDLGMEEAHMPLLPDGDYAVTFLEGEAEPLRLRLEAQETYHYDMTLLPGENPWETGVGYINPLDSGYHLLGFYPGAEEDWRGNTPQKIYLLMTWHPEGYGTVYDVGAAYYQVMDALFDVPVERDPMGTDGRIHEILPFHRPEMNRLFLRELVALDTMFVPMARMARE